MSIIDKLKEIQDEELISFHVPGHKNGRLLGELPYGKEIGLFDTTEIPGTDNLHAPEGCIFKTQQQIAEFYGAKESFLLVNGTTGGILSMIYAAFKPGDKVIIGRDAHKSIFTGMILAQVEPIYVSPEVDENLGINLGVSADTVSKVYEKYNDIKGMIITYPNYNGICTALTSIESIVHAHDGILLVDGAHGAHLSLNDELPRTAIELGVDIVVHSTHKSLGALTQSSLLHYCSKRVSSSKLKMALAMFQSSSPSYVLMASLENAFRTAKESGHQLMATLIEAIEEFSKELEKTTPFRVLHQSMLIGYSLDTTKITVLTQGTQITGGDLETVLRGKYGIQCEYGTDSTILFIATIGNRASELKSLLSALQDVSQEIEKEKKQDCSNDGKRSLFDFKKFELIQGITPSEGVHLPKSLVSLQESIGQCAGEFIVPYPPGIPVVVPGEIISEQVVNYIEEGIRKGYNINGVYDGHIQQVNIIKKVTK